MATKYYNKPSDPKIKWEDMPTVSDEENDVLAGESVAASKKSTPKYDTNLSDAEQARRITKALVPAKKSTPSSASKTKMDRMKDAYKSYGSSSDTAENQAVQKRLAGGPASYGFKKGGSVKSSASSRGDGCAQRGKTRGRVI